MWNELASVSPKGKLVVSTPETQTVEAVVELLKYLDRPSDHLPEAVQLTGIVLVLSNRRDVYYATTADSCSCPSAFYKPGQRCKHQRKYFPGPKKSQAEIDAESDAELERLHKAKWVGGFNGPVDPDTIKAKQDQEA